MGHPREEEEEEKVKKEEEERGRGGGGDGDEDLFSGLLLTSQWHGRIAVPWWYSFRWRVLSNENTFDRELIDSTMAQSPPRYCF